MFRALTNRTERVVGEQVLAGRALPRALRDFTRVVQQARHHQVRTWHDDAAQMPAARIDSVYRHRGAHAHDAERALLETSSADHREPAVYAELRRLGIGVANAA